MYTTMSPLSTSLLRSRTLFQVDRVLKSGGIVGLVSINLPACVDSVTMDTARLCMFDLVNQYGSPEKVKLLFENYKNLVVPYPTRKPVKGLSYCFYSVNKISP